MLQSYTTTTFNATDTATRTECPICLEEFDQGIGQEIVLRCKHVFHKDCLVKCLLFQYKTQNGFRCPICRRGVCCDTKRMLLYDTYMHTRQDYKTAKKQASRARSHLMNWNMKHQIMKFFKKYTAQEAFEIVARDEELTYEMHKMEALMRQKQAEYYNVKVFYEKPCCARCQSRYYHYYYNHKFYLD